MRNKHIKSDNPALKFPLTQSQLSIWMGQRLSPDIPLYNMPHTFELFGELSKAHFHQAFQLVIDHFDTLRIVFGEDENNTPFQTVLRELKYESEIIDLAVDEGAGIDLDDLINRKAQRKFELSEPLFESVLIKKSDNNYLWMLTAHHLIIDISSIQLIYSTTAWYYQDLLNGEKISGPVHSFVDYIDYERNFIKNSSNHHYFEYWNGIRTNLATIPKLYGRGNEGAKTSAIRVKIPFERNQIDQIRSLITQKSYRAINEDMSLYEIFSMLLFTYIHRITGNESITIGSLTSHRPSTKFKNTAGLFIQLLPLGVAIDVKESFKSLHAKVRHHYFDLLKNTVPGAAIPELSQGIGAVLNYIPIKFGSFGDIKTHMQWLHAGHIDKNHYLRLQVYDLNDQGLELHLDLNTSLLTTNQTKNAPLHFKRLTEAFLQDPDQLISEVSLTDQQERYAIDEKINSKDRRNDYKINSLSDLIGKKASSSIAISEEGNDITFNSLEEKTNQVANFLSDQGIGVHDRVVVRLKRSSTFIITILGILKTRASYVPVPVDYPEKRVRKIIENVKPSMVIVDSKNPVENIGNHFRIINSRQVLDLCKGYSKDLVMPEIDPDDPAYIMYTSGSTGEPKGVIISHKSLTNYLEAAKDLYLGDSKAFAPLFTSIGFDLTVTSLFLPLISGGCIHIYEEDDSGHDLSILKVIENRDINFIKLTPSHARLITYLDLSHLNLSTMIFGGEDLDTNLADTLQKAIGDQLNIYNEYGPTEATVGCIVKKYDPNEHYSRSVPIGKTFANATAYILDKGFNPVPDGVPGELYIGGEGLSRGYWDQPTITEEKFIHRDGLSSKFIYQSGDLVRLNEQGDLEYLGRIDQQLKVGGIRIEGSEIESLLKQYPGIQQVVIDQYQQNQDRYQQPEHYCKKCGLPSNYPNISFDENGVCDLCSSFETYQKNVSHYFRDLDELKRIMQQARARKKGPYDCMMLLSGGKDSSYALAQLVDLDLKVLAFTLENGYISDEAKANIKRVTDALAVDHVYGTTEYMNEIFVDSLRRFSNVCNGCFKALYTLSTEKALELGIPVIFTGLSRGQFFETRLTEELFRKKQFDIGDIDKIILDARKVYHRIPDAVSKYLNVSMYDSDEVFERVQFVDFYRYSDVSMTEMLAYLRDRLNWIRPSDTGRSTNCLINDLGIFMHKKERGYHNYAFPYSWDVRMGHKNRDEAIDELNDQIEEEEIKVMLDEIGYPSNQEKRAPQKQLVAYYKSEQAISTSELQSHLLNYLPASVIPANFIHLKEIPLSVNGKVDLGALSKLNELNKMDQVKYEEPGNEIEEIVASIWQEVFQLDQISIHHPFLELGGSSLLAIRIISRINEQLHLDLSVTTVFEQDTIKKLASSIEEIIENLMNEKN